ncbi:DEAD/DEAH box helicase [Alloiococcus sp. CFN-8]|uniref:DEAD/DEAH box helicase n=1 Tax=Alloiococcus sp. CFN-8 TaxID=3416081 RepID=UPI003CEDA37A
MDTGEVLMEFILEELYREIEENAIELPVEVKTIIEKSYLVKNKLIVNSQRGNLLKELKLSLSECISFSFAVAFVNFSGLQLLLDSFKELEERGIKGRIITSTYLNFTEPKALERIKEFDNIDMKIFIADNDKGFHTKAYIFENVDNYKIIIGSSNITQKALKSNVEWNVMIISKKEADFVTSVLEEYQGLWNCTDEVNGEFLDKYRDFIATLQKRQEKSVLNFSEYKSIKPNSMQVRALEGLKRLRTSGEDKGLVVAATGTGKTYMAAFDALEVKPRKLLFLVHREDILLSAERTFKTLSHNKNVTTGFYTGNAKDKGADYLFATRSTMEKHYEAFAPEEFDYIVIDEAHHSTSPTYKKILEYFKPKFLLGITATPERCDEGNIFDVFDNNVALEIRLHEALEEDLIVPFHYFGITDVEGVDLEGVDLNDTQELAKRLMINKRVDFIAEKMNFYGFDGEYQKTIGFCQNREHAKYMAEEFNKRGIESIVLTGDDSVSVREEGIKRLESNDDPLKVIFTVDIFNEGVDIPAINQVLMLRPTNSPIIFIQQLGRGLRKFLDKSFLTVIDFIGNHNKTFLIAIALKGERYYDKDSLKVAVATDFSNVPGCTNIQIDRISQERILKQLNQENFYSLRYFKEEYNNFKAFRGGRIPSKLMDYIQYDGAPDPLKFLKLPGIDTYQDFLLKVEKGIELKEYTSNEVFKKFLKELSSKLPIKRPHEFAILKFLINNDSITLEQAKGEIERYLDSVDMDTIDHAFRTLNQDFYDPAQKKRFEKLVQLNENILYPSIQLKNGLQNKELKGYFEDLINYGLLRYQNNFGSENYGIPFFKLYEQYRMIDIALLSNYEKTHSAYRGSGLLTNGKEFFLFVDLHKEEDVREEINYKDEFINQSIFQWQTPNSTGQDSDRGKDIIFNKDRGVNLHLFIRKYKEIDGVVQPYIYIGKGDTIEYEGEKPITTKLKLLHKLPEALYIEFVKKV